MPHRSRARVPALVAPSVIAAVAWLSAGRGADVQDAAGALSVRAIAPDVLRIEYLPTGVTAHPTEMLDPASRTLRQRSVGTTLGGAGGVTTAALRAATTAASITIHPAGGGADLVVDRASLARGVLRLTHPDGEQLYGLRSYGLSDSREPRLTRSNGLTRDLGAPVKAAAQGDGGAPLVYSASWGLLVDSIDGDVTNAGGALEFSHGSRQGEIEAYIVLGPPKRTIAVATDLTGHPPLFPRWALGFMNSQWGTTEDEVTSIVATYRQKQIPIDAFILDFDFKAWGEDDYGEFRWNSTSGAGAVAPNKFPDGQSGEFAKRMAAQGVHLVGIMKPRILVENTAHQPTKGAAEATASNWWMAKPPYNDYFSKRLANDLDFSKPAVRAWYWQHARALFDTGIAGWWNDEADDGFDSLGFFHMQQSLYEGQRGVSPRRVWSLNRNFYLGAQRFAFGTWSGDIRTGFAVMADQRARMLTMTDLAQPHWSMDTGGFSGHPAPENYARWIEFAAVVPIMRVHNTLGEHRQPWVYGPVAEAAAKRAIELRYTLQPSLYSWEHEAAATGAGIVRPLFWEFPGDPASANVSDSWMLGGALLVSPIVEQGQTMKTIYLPPGRWSDYWTGAEYNGGHTVEIATDATTWADIPMFVRGGSILATQPVQQFTGASPVAELTLDIWPDTERTARLEVWDDDGETYAYERGTSFSQVVTATAGLAGDVTVALSAPGAGGRPAFPRYRIVVHGAASGVVTWNGRAITATSVKDARQVVVPAGQAGTLVIKGR